MAASKSSDRRHNRHACLYRTNAARHAARPDRNALLGCFDVVVVVLYAKYAEQTVTAYERWILRRTNGDHQDECPSHRLRERYVERQVEQQLL